MNRTLIFICSLFFLFVTATVHAQKVTTQDINIDFKKRTLIHDTVYRQLRKLNKGDFVRFVITDESGELGKYKILINKKDSVVPVNDAPALFSSFVSPDGFLKFLTGILSFSVKTPGQTSQLPPSVKTQKVKPEDDDKEQGKKPVKPTTNVTLDSAIGYKDALLKDAFLLNDSVIIPVSRFMLRVNTKKLKSDTVFYDSAVLLLNKRNAYIRMFEEHFNRYTSFALTAPANNNSLISLNKADSIIQQLRKGYFEYVKGFDTVFNIIKIAEVYNALVKGRPAKKYEYRSMPVQMLGDVLNISLSFEPLKADEGLQSYKTDFTIPNRINRVLTFSTGVFYSGLIDDRYSNQLIQIKRPGQSDSLRYQLVKEDAGNGSFGINALLHAGTRIYNDLGIQFAFGPGLTLEKNPSPTLHVGAGIYFGRQNKIFLTGGFTWGFTERLSKTYNTSVTYDKEQSGFTYDAIRRSGFISLSYSFIK